MKYLSESKEEDLQNRVQRDLPASARPTVDFCLILDENLAKRTKCQQQARNVTDMAVGKPECCI